MKRTAVTWLISQIVEDQTIRAKSMTEWINIFEQAKAMYKDEIIKFANDYLDDDADLTAEQYHTITREQ